MDFLHDLLPQRCVFTLTIATILILFAHLSRYTRTNHDKEQSRRR